MELASVGLRFELKLSVRFLLKNDAAMREPALGCTISILAIETLRSPQFAGFGALFEASPVQISAKLRTKIVAQKQSGRLRTLVPLGAEENIFIFMLVSSFSEIQHTQTSFHESRSF